MALTTKEKVKEYLGITVTDYDDLLDSLISRMSTFIEQYCNRSFDEAEHTEQYDGTLRNSGLIRLNQIPVSAIASIHDDTTRAFGTETLIEASKYVFYGDSGVVQLDHGYEFKIGYQNIKVVYTAGYATIPGDLEQATIELVAYKFQVRGKEGIRSEKLGRWSIDS